MKNGKKMISKKNKGGWEKKKEESKKNLGGKTCYS